MKHRWQPGKITHRTSSFIPCRVSCWLVVS